MTYPTFNNGDTLPASDLNAIGLWLVKTQAVGTGVPSVTVTGAFSADYDNYLVTVDNVVSSSGDTTFFFLPGADTATATYSSGGMFVLYTGAGVGYNANSATTAGIGVGITSTTNTSLSFMVYDPFLPKWTRAMGNMSSGDNYVATYGGVQKKLSQYTAFNIYPASGTFTGGTIRVYGYRN
jgi:hypothetical protein